MIINDHTFTNDFSPRFEVFRELMAYEVREILLISNLYNIFNLEEDGSLTSKIVNEYIGLNLSNPPRISGVSSVEEALALLHEKDFDMVLIVPHLEEMDVFSLGGEIKRIKPHIPVLLLSPGIRAIYPLPESSSNKGIDKTYIWSGNPDLLIALVKNAEDHLNVAQDTTLASVRVLILVEDSPDYYSFFLPIIYKEIVTQTQALLSVGLNDNQKLLIMRARPKILLAKSYEEAMELYEKYRSFLLGVISDTRLPRDGKTDPHAGLALLAQIRKEIPEVPLLLMSSEPENGEKAGDIPSLFLDKNSPTLLQDTHNFFLNHLGFGDFVFRMPDGQEIDRAKNLLKLEAKLHHIPDESIIYHADRDHFSNWLMARSEIDLALKFRAVKRKDFKSADDLRHFIISNIHELRKIRQKGIVSSFNRHHFDSDVRDFIKIGQGSLGGKARGLAFMSSFLKEHGELFQNNREINIKIPKTLVLCTDVFETFVTRNNLQAFSRQGVGDEEVRAAFLNADLPGWLLKKLKVFLSQVKIPLAVRSSSQLEDAQAQPYAGLYQTYKIPNNHPNLLKRLDHLTRAIKLVYASTYYEDAKSFYKNTTNRPFNDSMAVIIQEMAGDQYGDYFYPAISGVAQSYNYYPFSRMKPEEGIVRFALGLGKTVVEGERSLRFSPRHPHIMPQFSTVEDILKNSQTTFYALKTNNYPDTLHFEKHSNLEKRDVDDARDEFPVKTLASTHIADENRIIDTGHTPGPKVLTFARPLKFNTPPVPKLICDLLELGSKAMGGPVEIEFAVNLYPETSRRSDFFFLQIRPMVAYEKQLNVEITQQDLERAFCFSSQALGNGINGKMADMVYVKPNGFKPEATVQMAEEISKINARLLAEKRPYLLAGPGRWGASDRWLGIPVKWQHISGVGAIVELKNEKINADPSQGSHFFHNITSLGIPYITVNETAKGGVDYVDWKWLDSLPAVSETAFLRHVRLETPLVVKLNGKKSQCVMLKT